MPRGAARGRPSSPSKKSSSSPHSLVRPGEAVCLSGRDDGAVRRLSLRSRARALSRASRWFGVLAGPRVGVDYAGPAALWPLRFAVAGCAAVTGRRASHASLLIATVRKRRALGLVARGDDGRRGRPRAGDRPQDPPRRYSASRNAPPRGTRATRRPREMRRRRRRIAGGVRQEDDELSPSSSGRDAVRPRERVESARAAAGLVAEGVAVGVVQGLETVDVDREYGRPAQTAGAIVATMA